MLKLILNKCLPTSQTSVFTTPIRSWASLKPAGIFWVRGDEIRPRNVEISNCKTTPKTIRLPFGQVIDGQIRICRPHTKAQSSSCSKDERVDLTVSTMSTTGSARWSKGKSKTTLRNLAQDFEFPMEWDVDLKPEDSHFFVHLRVSLCGLLKVFFRTRMDLKQNHLNSDVLNCCILAKTSRALEHGGPCGIVGPLKLWLRRLIHT